MSDHTHTPTLSSYDEDQDALLIDLLGKLGQDDDNARLESIQTLRTFPELFWNRERIEGAFAALVPVAESAKNEDIAFSLWNLLASLLQKHRQEAPGEDDAFETSLLHLLGAEHPDIRGFAATSLSALTTSEVTQALLQRLAEETRWDVSMRLIAALTLQTRTMEPKDLTGLLRAPTQEALVFAAQKLAEITALETTPDLVRRLENQTGMTPPARTALERALRTMDLFQLNQDIPSWFRKAEELPPKEDSPELRVWQLHDLRRNRFSLHTEIHLNLHRELPLEEPCAELHLTLRLPSREGGELVERLGQALQKTLGAEARHTRIQRVPERPESAEITLKLQRQSVREKIKTFRALLEALQLTLRDLDKGPSPNETRVHQEAKKLIQRWQTPHSLFFQLGAEHQHVRSALGGTARILAQQSVQGQDALLLQEEHSLGTPHPHTGLLCLFNLPKDSDASLESLQNLFAWKFDRRSEALSREETQSWICASGIQPTHKVLGIRGFQPPPRRFDPEPEMVVLDVLKLAEERTLMAQWIKTLVHAQGTHQSFDSLLGGDHPLWTWNIPASLPDLQEEDIEEKTEQDAKKEKLLELKARAQKIAEEKAEKNPPPEEDTTSELPRISLDAPTREYPQVPQDSKTREMPRTAAAPSLPSKPAPALPSRPAAAQKSNNATKSTPALPSRTPSLPGAPGKPSGSPSKPAPSLPSRPAPSLPSAAKLAKPTPALPSRKGAAPKGQPPLDESGQTPSEVIRGLDAKIETVDIYLRSTGYNHTKLMQIMSILLGMAPGEARAVIENAPCLLLGEIPRDRARTIKTVLDGTGAKIKVVSSGEDPGEEE